MPDSSASAAAPSASAEPCYGRFYYSHDCGTPYERNDLWLDYFNDVADRIVDTYRPGSLLDAGCAMGLLVECLRARGVEAYGVDVSDYAIGQVHESVAEHCFVGSLADGLPAELPDWFDMVTCVEVIEHVPPALEHRSLRTLTSATDCLYLSSSPLDYGEATHVNVHPPEYWATRLAELGFHRDVDAPHLIPAAPWGGVFVRGVPNRPELVEGYERGLWRARHEATDLRNSIQRMQQEMAALDDKLADAAKDRELVVRARATEDELAALQTRLQHELDDHDVTAARLDEVLESTSWRISQAVLAPYRRLRTRRG